MEVVSEHPAATIAAVPHTPASGVRRSLSPFPPRTTISRRSTSTSFTRSVTHSRNRSPLPYINDTQRRDGSGNNRRIARISR
jgi:hypothetical protein